MFPNASQLNQSPLSTHSPLMSPGTTLAAIQSAAAAQCETQAA